MQHKPGHALFSAHAIDRVQQASYTSVITDRSAAFGKDSLDARVELVPGADYVYKL